MRFVCCKKHLPSNSVSGSKAAPPPVYVTKPMLKQLTAEEKTLVRSAIDDAKNACNESLHDIECAIAWDTVDEVIRGINTRMEHRFDDPLELYCAEFPDNDECRMYDV